MNLLYDKLITYNKSDYYGFHMPGNKRNEQIIPANLPYSVDLTEVPGFDDLHHPEGVIQQLQERSAAVYESEDTRLLINGSTAGLLSAILGCTKKGETILVARNSHKSVYHGIYLNELRPIYLYPKIDMVTGVAEGIPVQEVEDALESALEKGQKIAAVIVTSPTYEGVLSRIDEIAAVTSSYQVPLIVDAAHGAHLGFDPYFPANAVSQGADVVIHSLHKTLPALTQTGLIHLNGNLIEREKIEYYLQLFQTSSPSYPLMASIDLCIALLAEEREKHFSPYVKELEKARIRLKKLKNLRLVESAFYDFSKLVISTAGTPLSGLKLSEILLDRYRLQMEMSTATYVVGMTSIADTKEGFERLMTALFEIEEELSVEKESKKFPEKNRNLILETEQTLDTRQKESKEAEAWVEESGETKRFPEMKQVYSIKEAKEKAQDKERITSLPWESSVGKVSTEFIYLYPPGAPMIIPGEQINKKIIKEIKKCTEVGFSIKGTKKQGEIEVLSL